MADSFPPDEFDDPALHGDRVGAHRQRRMPGRRWIIFGSCVVAVALIVGVGFLMLNMVRQGNQFDFSKALGVPGSSTVVDSATSSTASAPSSSAASSVAAPTSSAPVADKTAKITVLNATNTSGLAAAAKTALKTDGWTNVTVGNDASRLKTSTVTYPTAADAASAAAAAKVLGIGSVELSTTAGSQIVVTLGADYSG